ncbi:MAG TPA: 2-isopropylmalate synthase, partial [Pseudobacteroides sp.]
MRIEIMDTTLRDGEQTPGLAYTQHEKLTIAKTLLEDVKVDRIEVASANVSTGELASVQAISSMCQKLGCLDKVEVLGFADKTRSVDWIVSSGARVMNLLCKGSLNHVTNQLRKAPEQHLEDVKFVIDYAAQKNIKVNVYLEDWSNGMMNSPDYVF